MSLIVYVFMLVCIVPEKKKIRDKIVANLSSLQVWTLLFTAYGALNHAWTAEIWFLFYEKTIYWCNSNACVALETTVWERKGGWTCDSLGEMRHRIRNNQITSVLCNMFIKVKIQVKNKENIRVVVCEIKGETCTHVYFVIVGLVP